MAAFTERKFAYKKLIKSPDGKISPVIVDAKSGQPVVDPRMYTIIDSSADTENPDATTNKTGDESEQEDTYLPHESSGYDGKSDTSTDRSAGNNYGYEHKPGFMSALAAAPGMVGLGARAIGVAMNANNNVAANQARSMLGMEEKSNFQNARDILHNTNPGYVGDLAIDDKTTAPVGFEATDKNGRTTLTANEARMREQLAGATPATAEQAKASTKSFAKENPKAGGIFSGLKQGIADLKSNIFGSPKEEPAANPRGVSHTPAKSLSAEEINDPDLPARDMASVSANMGPNRPNMPASDIVDNIQTSVTDALGPDYHVSVTSGQEDPGHQYGSTRHKTGMAADVQITDPQNRVVGAKTEEMKDLAQASAAQFGANVGFGEGYMGGSHIHIDEVPADQLDPGQGRQWGKQAKEMEARLADARTYGTMPPSYYDKMTVDAPTPSPAPREDMVAQTQEQPQGYTDPMGYMNAPREFTPEEKDLMGRTLAGEIDLGKTDLNTDEGRMEAFGMLSTMENRSPKYGGIEKAITAKDQYSTWSDAKAASVANKNYDANPDVYSSVVDAYTADPQNNLGFTNYYNADIADPNWSKSLTDTISLGPHTFGVLSEYQTPGVASVGGFMANPQTNPTASINQTAGLGWSNAASQGITASAPDMKDTTEQDAGSMSSGSPDSSDDGSSGNEGSGGDSSGGFSDNSDDSDDSDGNDD